MASTGCAVSLLITAGPGGAAGESDRGDNRDQGCREGHLGGLDEAMRGVRQDVQQVTGVDQVTEQHAEQPPVHVYALTRLLCYGALRPGHPP
jgi:hypothetical protein